MAVVKLSKSGKQVQIIDDDGNMFVTSTVYMAMLLQGNAKRGLVLLSRLPIKVSSERFAKSPVYDPGGLLKQQDKYDNPKNDGLSKAFIKGNEEKKQFTDKKVW